MEYLLARWLILTLAIGLTAELMPGVTVHGGLPNLIWIAAVFGLVNGVIRPLLTLMTCPLVILTLGLFTLVINTLMLQLTAWLVPALSVDSFWTAFLASLVISIVSTVLNLFVKNNE